MWLVTNLICALTAFRVLVKGAGLGSCVSRGLKEVSVRGADGVYCIEQEPCAGNATSITRFGCPVSGQVDVSGVFTLQYRSCCGVLSDGIIGCLLLNEQTSRDSCLPKPSWYDDSTSAEDSNAHQSSRSNYMKFSEENLQERKEKTASARDTSQTPRVDLVDSTTSTKSNDGVDASFIALVVVFPSLAVAAIAGGILLRAKTSRQHAGWNDSNLHEAGDEDDAAYHNIPLTPKEEVHLL